MKKNLTNEMSKDKKVVSDLRFIKLSAVDEEYKTKITSIMMGPDDMLNLQELVNRFINFSASQLHLYYDKKVIRAFFRWTCHKQNFDFTRYIWYW